MTRRILLLYFGAFLGPMGGNAVLALIPALKNAFSVDVASITLSITFFMLPFAFLQLFSGAISDIYGRYKVLVFGFLVYSISSLICALSSNITLFLIARVLQGLGFAFINPVVLAILGDITSEEHRGKVMGGLGSAVTAGIAFGPLTAGFLAEVDWRITFVLIAILSLMMGIILRFKFKGERSSRKRFRLKVMLLKIGLVLTHREVILLSISGLLVFLSMVGVMSYIPDLLSQSPYLYRDSEIGLIISMAGFAGILASPLAGVMVDSIGRIKTGLLGSFLMLIVFSLLIFGDSFLEFSILFSFLGFSSAIVWASFQTLATEFLPSARGSVSSLFNSFRFFGYALAPALLSPFYVNFGIYPVYLIGVFLMFSCTCLVYLMRRFSR